MGGIEGWTHPAVLAGAVLFVLATPLFFWLQNTVTDPLLDLSLFRNRLSLWMGITGAGAGLFNSPNASSIMASVAPAQRGVASGIRMLLAFTGSMISIAFVLAIVTSSLPKTAMPRIFSGVTSGLPLADVSPFIVGVRIALLVLGLVRLLSAPLSLLRGAEESRRYEAGPLAAV